MAKKKASEKVVQIPETTYSHDEILQAAKSFGETQEVVAGALRVANKEKLSRTEVEKAIRTFKTRKV